MYRPRSSIPYDILHGLRFPANFSAILAYMSYFPPPPPIFPGPPPRRSLACSSNSFSSLPCIISNDHNLLYLHKYSPLININQSTSTTNTSHKSIINSSHSTQTLSSLDYILILIQNHFSLILILSIFLFLICLSILFLFFQCLRQRQNTSNNKNHAFYYHLIPHRRRKHQTKTQDNEHNLTRLRKDSPTLRVIRLSRTSGKHKNDNNEAEDTL
ncbi:unnamed protein product [Adineta steineri]|uniref:Uncharacterized protein n=1 Tax=Adineta steineri TaxID=433720 RepID=A0A818N6L8_9BILA|nr:unnamed protein product [Adineta steineri]CAF3600603.1 unnamed protein product [Adineta steineri]